MMKMPERNSISHDVRSGGGLQAIFERETSDSEHISILLTILATRPRVVVSRSQVALVA